MPWSGRPWRGTRPSSGPGFASARVAGHTLAALASVTAPYCPGRPVGAGQSPATVILAIANHNSGVEKRVARAWTTTQGPCQRFARNGATGSLVVHEWMLVYNTTNPISPLPTNYSNCRPPKHQQLHRDATRSGRPRDQTRPGPLKAITTVWVRLCESAPWRTSTTLEALTATPPVPLPGSEVSRLP
jgi:hypothetical protein